MEVFLIALVIIYVVVIITWYISARLAQRKK